MEIGQENQISTETRPFVIPPTDCLVEFGHSIVKGKNGQWYLTELLQPIIELGIAPDDFKKFVRSAIKEPVATNDESAIVGGGIITNAATVEIVSELKEANHPPRVVVHTGGRPSYLDKAAADEPSLTEGKIMEQSFNARFRAKNPDQVEPLQELIEQGKNTEDDIRAGLEMAIKHGCKSVSFVGMEIRLMRCQAFYAKIMAETDKYQSLTVNFLPAENVISNIAARKGRSEQWQKILENYRNSKGYKRTFEAELGGIQAMQKGTYGQALGGLGKT